MELNPILKMDYPDPDVIRVGDTYYMISTTMHFFPGGALLRSFDLVHWEMYSYVFDRLDDTPAQRLEGEQNIYGQGMWAASLRYHKGRFYVCFVANDTHRAYLYTAEDPAGPWTRRPMEGFYHDCSLFFEEDGSVYIVYGNTDIRLTQLKPDLSGPLPGGLDRVIVREQGNKMLGYEGSHMYRIGGRYYVFFIHSLPDRWMRVESCFAADSLTGEFTGGDVLEDTRGYCGQGVAQGGIVDTPSGDWYAVLFQDSGAVGRIPVLLPVHFEEGFPVFGEKGKVPEYFLAASTRPGAVCGPLYASDRFLGEESGELSRLKKVWQFNHQPREGFWGVGNGRFWIRTGKLSRSLTEAQNTLTQRLLFPSCKVSVTLDFSGLSEGDCAGLCALQSCWGMIGVVIEQGRPLLVMEGIETQNPDMNCLETDAVPKRYAQAELTGRSVRLSLQADFWQMKDEVSFSYDDGTGERRLGPSHKLYFKLDHFCGCRVGLFVFSTQREGGVAAFEDFVYEGSRD
ncbi:MAG: family 43 glycosylhydrolase [Eubacteriales bacterium]|nr:family 43 glycosylhydrolase [Eubacteriales bacterium]